MTADHQLITLRHQSEDGFSVLRSLPPASVDAVVTDPPYLLGFMGREWDTRAAHEALDWHRAWCDEAFRVLKPGGHLLAFGGTRTWHRLACAVEDAGFEVRDSIAWMYGSGFPKSLDVSKAIDKAAGAEREPGLPNPWAGRRSVSLNGRGGTVAVEGGDFGPTPDTLTTPATDAAREWQGWGTALKPAFEPVVVARKPLTGTVAQTVLEHGTGALNIGACRIAAEDAPEGRLRHGGGSAHSASMAGPLSPDVRPASPAGRWPANVVLDESQAAALDQQSGELTSGKMQPTHTDAAREVFGQNAAGGYTTMETYGDTGGASRFFYVAKAGADERPRVNGTAHPTVKPLALMRWLVRLVTPPGGLVLDPFAGSGTTVEACLLEGFHCIAIEREPDYLPLIESRIARRIDPVKAVELAGDDAGLFDLLGEETA